MSDEHVVVDASAILSLLVDPGELADRVADRLSYCHLHAPDHLSVEVMNSIRRRRNAGLLSNAQAQFAMDRYWDLPFELWTLEVLRTRAWELGQNLSSYDAAYVALAEHLGASLITGDARIARAPGPACPIVLMP